MRRSTTIWTITSAADVLAVATPNWKMNGLRSANDNFDDTSLPLLRPLLVCRATTLLHDDDDDDDDDDENSNLRDSIDAANIVVRR